MGSIISIILIFTVIVLLYYLAFYRKNTDKTDKEKRFDLAKEQGTINLEDANPEDILANIF